MVAGASQPGQGCAGLWSLARHNRAVVRKLVGDDGLVTSPSLLAVFAHPDDESLAAGGLLARQASGGARTGVGSGPRR